MACVTFTIWSFFVPVIVSVHAWLQSALFHHQFKIFACGNVPQDVNRRLAVTKLNSFVLDGPVDCTFRCIGEPQCLPFNLAAHPDSDHGLYQSDLLATDKYRAAAKDLQANGTFHHYSPWVNIRTPFLFFSFEGATGKEDVN